MHVTLWVALEVLFLAIIAVVVVYLGVIIVTDVIKFAVYVLFFCVATVGLIFHDYVNRRIQRHTWANVPLGRYDDTPFDVLPLPKL